MSNKIAAYMEARTKLLEQITTTLQEDDRFVAAWLAGSFGRGEQDAWSNLDVSISVAEAASETLCATPWSKGSRTTRERLALFQQFGEPVVIYDDHTNVAEGASFTYVLYGTSALTVNWTLIPQSKARRPDQSLLLFEKMIVPLEPFSPPEALEQRMEQASMQIAFFWTMVPIILKYFIRHDIVFFDLHLGVKEVENLVAGVNPPPRPGWGIELYLTRKERIDYLISLCQRMQQLAAQVVQQGGSVAEPPLPIIELWLDMEKNPQRRKQYAADREDLLASIAAALKSDERFVAAWLEGSYVHGNKDDLSDLDLRVVVADISRELSAVTWTSPSPHTTSERYRLFSQFGQPFVTWDTQTFSSIAEEGSFTLVYYDKIGVHVDWVLIPHAKAERPVQSLLLFDKVGVPLKPPPEVQEREKRLEQVTNDITNFWMVAAESYKYLLRRDLAYYHLLLEQLQNTFGQIREFVDGTPRAYTHTVLYSTTQKQVAALRSLCDEMETLMPQVVALGGDVPTSPREVVEMRLALVS